MLAATGSSDGAFHVEHRRGWRARRPPLGAPNRYREAPCPIARAPTEIARRSHRRPRMLPATEPRTPITTSPGRAQPRHRPSVSAERPVHSLASRLWTEWRQRSCVHRVIKSNWHLNDVPAFTRGDPVHRPWSTADCGRGDPRRVTLWIGEDRDRAGRAPRGRCHRGESEVPPDDAQIILRPGADTRSGVPHLRGGTGSRYPASPAR